MIFNGVISHYFASFHPKR